MTLKQVVLALIAAAAISLGVAGLVDGQTVSAERPNCPVVTTTTVRPTTTTAPITVLPTTTLPLPTTTLAPTTTLVAAATLALSVTAGDQQVSLNWTEATNMVVTRYEVWKNNAYVAGLPVTARSYVATGLTNGSSYSFRVVAYNAAGAWVNSPTVSGTPVGPTTTTTVPASGTGMPTGNLPGWTMLFNDDFNTNVPLGQFPAAVSNKWFAYPYPWTDTSHAYRSDPGVYWPEKVVSISGGVLDKWLRTENGKPLVTALVPRINGLTGDPKYWADADFDQLYGRYAIRFRSDVMDGYKIAWLLWPQSNVWPRDGEIDFPETDLSPGNGVEGFVHYQGGVSGGDQYAMPRFAVDTRQYHTAVIEWSPNLVRYLLDGVERGRTTERVPNTPMHWVIQTETEIFSGTPPPSTSGHLNIDWVAVWKYTP